MPRAREETSKRYRLEEERYNYRRSHDYHHHHHDHQISRKNELEEDLEFSSRRIVSKKKSQLRDYEREEGEIIDDKDFDSKAYPKSAFRERRSRSRDDDNVYRCSGRDNRIRGSDRKREREREDRDIERSVKCCRESQHTNENIKEGEEGNVEGDECEKEDYVEVKEEDDYERIIEESRKLREKFKLQHQEKKDSHIVNEVPVLLVGTSKGDYYEVKDEDDDERIFEENRKLREKFKLQHQKEEKKDSHIVNKVPVLLVGTSKAEPFSVGLVNEDMLCENDIFGGSSSANTVCNMTKCPILVERTTSLNFDEWDDQEGYYKHRLGEVLDSRFEVTAALGKGVFSTVVRAKDLKAAKGDPTEVAIKIIRNNHVTYKAGLGEQVILKKLADADPKDRCHCVRFISSFKYRNHFCLVFEKLHMNLRGVLKKFGSKNGLSLAAVRRYAKQLFIALEHLRKCNVLHSDIKPDNILVTEAMTTLKLCDFGNAMLAGKNELTPYLVSRFFRAPEVILGLPYDYAVDIWSVGCCLYELYCGKALFPGASNNDMLRLHMQLKGLFPKRMLRNGAFTKQNFDLDLNFIAARADPIGKKPVDMFSLLKGHPGEDDKMLAKFRDLLDKIFILDPEKRLTVSQALNHPFITGSQLHRPLPPRIQSCSATAFRQSPASMHMMTKVRPTQL